MHNHLLWFRVGQAGGLSKLKTENEQVLATPTDPKWQPH